MFVSSGHLMSKTALAVFFTGVMCLLVAALVRRSLDLSILDVYFVISAKYLLIAGLLLVAVSLALRLAH